MSETRKLATILALDMVGYSRATEQDDSAAADSVRKIRALLTSIAEPLGGRLFSSAGDGFLLEFQTATSGLEAALAMLEAFKANEPPLQVRIGLHAGEVIVEQDGDLLGHAVNIAARLQQRARPGEIVLSEDVKRSARGVLTRNLVSLGDVKLDKMSETIDIYAAGGGLARTPRLRFGATSRLVLAGATLLAAIFAGSSLLFLHSRPGPERDGRVEITSFRPLQEESADLDQRAARLHATLVRLLATGHVQTLVASRNDAAGDNRAEMRITGTIDRTADAISFVAQVVDRPSDVVLWSASFERPADEAEGIELEVGLAIMGVLRCALDERSTSRRPLSTEVFSLLLNACDATMRWQTDMQSTTRDLVEAAPNFGAAHALHALASMIALEHVAHSPEQAEQLRNQARRSAERALAINPRLPRAHVVLADLADDVAESERLLQRGLEAGPENPAALAAYMIHLRRVGRLNASRDLGDRIVRIPNPQMLNAMPVVAFNRAMDGDLTGAEEAIRFLESVDPSAGSGLRWVVAVWWGDPAEVLQRLHQLAVTAGISRRSEDCFRLYLTRLRSPGNPGLPASCDEYRGNWRIRMLAREGDIEGAYAEVQRNEQQVRDFPGFVFYPEMREFRRDARFMPLMQRMGLVDYWLETGYWPDFCSEPALPFDCRDEARRVSAALRAP